MIKPLTVRWVLLVLAVLAIILIPFFLFGDRIQAWTADFLSSASSHPFTAALVLGSLLASDILLPIPSSMVSTGSGFVLGLAGGFAASWTGMTVSTLIGYALGARARSGVSRRLLGEEEQQRLERLYQRFGDGLIVVTRPVPVLAEAAVLFAGIGAMPFPRFLALTALSNAAISAVYAAVGACSASLNSFLLAFAASMLIPLLVMTAFKHFNPPRRS